MTDNFNSLSSMDNGDPLGDRRIDKYLAVCNEIRQVIISNPTNKDELIDDVVDAISNLARSPTWLHYATFGISLYKNYLKRQKLKKVIESILRKIFDVTLGWYVMDYQDVKNTCDYIGGRDYFSRESHRHIYIAVIQKLKDGPIRDKCIELGVVCFVNEKLVDIRNNWLTFKSTEL